MKRASFILLLVQFIVVILIGIYIIGDSKEVGYVRSAYLIENFIGTQEARAKLQEDVQFLQSNLDTLKSEYSGMVGAYQENAEGDEKMLQRIQGKESSIATYSKAAEERIQQQETELLEGVMNQINSYMKTYAEEHGYDMILGTTAAGSILFGEDDMDITDKVLKEMNKHYGK
ncbi:MAG: OmpH family outer membrane protein [Flavobacteriales bacterium]|nr:OmpH family outer membrane protein [Flavobacteriales bacterium]